MSAITLTPAIDGTVFTGAILGWKNSSRTIVYQLPHLVAGGQQVAQLVNLLVSSSAECNRLRFAAAALRMSLCILLPRQTGGRLLFSQRRWPATAAAAARCVSLFQLRASERAACGRWNQRRMTGKCSGHPLELAASLTIMSSIHQEVGQCSTMNCISNDSTAQWLNG